MKMSNLKKQLLNIRASIFKPSPKLNLVEWADTYRYLSSQSSSTPGKWSTDRVEAARGPMLAITEPSIKKITVMGPTQLLKTELINNIVAYFIHQDPSPMIVMQPIEKLANTWSTDRLDPMLRDTPALKNLIKDKRERDSGNTKLHKTFPGGQLSIVSAGSPSDVASRPVRVVLLDEVDKYKSSGEEGDPIKLIEQRTETFWNALSVAVCSPTLDGSSKIAARFEESDQRFFHARCPHCNQYEKLEFKNVIFDSDDPESARYKCSHCRSDWSETQRLKAISNGKYIATKPFNGHAGFHVNAIASPWQPPSNLVKKFLEAKNDSEKMKVFVNTSLAETYKPEVETPDYNLLYERRESYRIGIVPDKQIVFLTCGVDVQQDRLEAQLIGWTKSKEAYVIDYKVFNGMTHTDEPWLELKQYIQKSFQVENKSYQMPISRVFIDSGFNSSKVYEFVNQFNPNFCRAIKGSDQLQMSFKIGNDINQNLKHKYYSHKLVIVGSSFLKDQLFNNLKLKNGPGSIHFPELDHDYFKSLTAEGLQQDKRGNWHYVKIRERNEALDTFIYALCAAHAFGVYTFTERDWQNLQGISIEPKIEIEKPQVNTNQNNHSSYRPPIKRRF